ncbi:hypothetical protein [Azospirillum doebereinerae]
MDRRRKRKTARKHGTGQTCSHCDRTQTGNQDVRRNGRVAVVVGGLAQSGLAVGSIQSNDSSTRRRFLSGDFSVRLGALPVGRASARTRKVRMILIIHNACVLQAMSGCSRNCHGNCVSSP